MKKVLLSMAAAACALCTFAQDANVVLPDSIWFTPYAEEGVVLDSVDDVITVHMDKVPSVPVTVMFVTGNGFGIDMQTKEYPVTEKSFTIELNRENWGVPYNEEFFMNLGVTFTYGEGEDMEYYLNDDGEPVIGEAVYMTHDNGPAEWVRTYPFGIWDRYNTYEDAYKDGEGTLYFTKIVSSDDVIGSATYYNEDGVALNRRPVSITKTIDAWSDADGLFAVYFKFSSDNYTAEEVSRIVIDFSGFTYEGQSVNVPQWVLKDSSSQNTRNLLKKSKQALEESLIKNENHLDIYNIQGAIILKNANAEDLQNLAPGIYIANGEKYIVR